MKQGWEIKKLGDVCDFQNGFAFKSNTYKETGLPILRITNIQNQSLELNDLVYFDAKDYKENFDRFKVFKDDLVVAMSGATTGKLGINTTDTVFYLNQRVGKFIPKKQILKTYLYYFLSTKVEESLRIAAGAAQPNLSTEQINNFEIPLPPLPEQQRIVSILDEAFAAIDKAKANAEQNLKNAKEVFESYLQGVFENGNNWQKQKLGDVCVFVRGPFGGSLKKNIFKPDGFAVYEQQHAIYDQFDNVRYFIDEIKFNEMKRFELRAGDLIMSCSGTMGKIAIVPENIKKGIINQALLKLSPSKKVYNSFLKLWMQSESFQNSLKEYAGGVAIQNVASVAILKNIEIPLPDLSEQKNIVQKVQAFSTETQKLEAVYQKKLDDLEELKKSVLQKAFAGEL